MNPKRLVAAGALLLLAACSTTTEAITQKPYAPSDGIRVHLDSDVVFENLMVLTDGSGEGVLVGLVNNRSEEDTTATIVADDFDAAFDVDANSHINFSSDEVAEEDELMVVEGDFQPGDNISAVIAASGSETTSLIPVISACTPEYEDFLPFTPDCD
ncbi:hypothetical protein [Flaviflexus massiliensis]|uniref:hypothetical protein n=1 Tax=Flaviflexus massiliensis TaxID=1522309 RepID=UPI0006D5B3BD|nr:hypothetical protein [Flaviflexus massiliensis]